MQLSDLLPVARDSITDPRAGFRQMRSLGLDRSTLLIALAAITVVGVIPAEIMVWLMARRGEVAMMNLGGGPFGLALMQFGAGLISCVAVHRIGRAFGGHASFEDSLLVVVWMQFILTIIQLVQLLILLVVPPLATVPGLLAIGLVFWLSSGFIAEAHGFRSQGKTFVGMLVSGFLIIVALAILLVVLGIVPEMPDV